MSYTPENEQIAQPLERCLEGLEELRMVMRNRLLARPSSGTSWDEGHKADLRIALSQMLTLELTLTRLR